MAVLKITAGGNSDNFSIFALEDSEGNPVNLDSIGATLVVVSICGGRYSTGALKIDSDSGAVEYSGSVLKVKFGKLKAQPQKQPYYPKIYYIAPTAPDGEVIAGEGYNTEIHFKAVY